MIDPFVCTKDFSHGGERYKAGRSYVSGKHDLVRRFSGNFRRWA